MSGEYMEDMGFSRGVLKLCTILVPYLRELTHPLLTRANTKADAIRIATIASMILKYPELDIVDNDGKITISKLRNDDVHNSNTLTDVLNLRKEENRRKSLAHAYEELSDENEVSDEPIKEDWFDRYLDYAGSISDEEMQMFWGKLLAGEIKHPNSFSLRTLDVLKNLSSEEAKLFTDLSRYFISVGNDICLISEKVLFDKFQLSFENITLLTDCNLIQAQSNIVENITVSYTEKDPLILNNKHYAILLSCNGSNENIVFSMPVYLLTGSGKEIYRIVNPITPVSSGYINDVAEYLQTKSDKLSVSTLPKT